MNQWVFVIAAYALTLTATVGLIVASWASMRRSESEAEASKRRP
jgi:hypothetical protein